MPQKARNRAKLRSRIIHWRHQAYDLSQFLGGDPDGLYQIRIIRKHDCDIVGVSKSTKQKMRRQIYVTSFLFSLVDTHNGGPWLGKLLSQRRPERRRVNQACKFLGA